MHGLECLNALEWTKECKDEATVAMPEFKLKALYAECL
jgi:hypothetical protein